MLKNSAFFPLLCHHTLYFSYYSGKWKFKNLSFFAGFSYLWLSSALSFLTPSFFNSFMLFLFPKSTCVLLKFQLSRQFLYQTWFLLTFLSSFHFYWDNLEFSGFSKFIYFYFQRAISPLKNLRLRNHSFLLELCFPTAQVLVTGLSCCKK